VVIAVLVILGLSSNEMQGTDFFESALTSLALTDEQADAVALLREGGVFEEMRRNSAGGIPSALIYVGAVIGGAAIIAGVLMSRALTRPLVKLQEMAQAIGRNDLETRVAVRGSVEMVELAGALNQMAADLESAESLRQNLLADVAHELRTPLTVIQGNLRAILDDVYPLEKEEIARLYDQTRHLNRLIDDLRDLAQAEARRLPLHIVDVDVALFVNELEAMFRPIIESEDIAFRAELLGALPTIHADRDRLKQAVSNLLVNAIQHTPVAGTITLQSERMDDAVELRVLDTGDGIKPEHIDHVFDRFYRIDAARSRDDGGTGLGLAIAKAIVEAHGGNIEVVSAGETAGTMFTIRLPLSQSKT
jgi:signal transduction histidine kinase